MRPHGGLVGRTHRVRELGVDGADQVTGNPPDHLGKLDRLRDVVDEVDQHPEVEQQERLGDGRRQMGDERGAQAVDGSQGEHGVDERADEDPQRHLVADVPHEVAHHAWAELLGCQRQCQDRDGEDHTDHREDGGGDGGQDLPFGIGIPRPDPDRQRHVAVVRRDVDLERGEEEQNRDDDEDARDDPQRRPQLLPPPARQLAPVLPDAAPAAAPPPLRCRSRRHRREVHRGAPAGLTREDRAHDGKNLGSSCRLAASSSSAKSLANGYCPTSGLANNARTTSSRLPEQAAFTAKRS